MQDKDAVHAEADTSMQEAKHCLLHVPRKVYLMCAFWPSGIEAEGVLT